MWGLIIFPHKLRLLFYRRERWEKAWGGFHAASWLLFHSPQECTTTDSFLGLFLVFSVRVNGGRMCKFTQVMSPQALHSFPPASSQRSSILELFSPNSCPFASSLGRPMLASPLSLQAFICPRIGAVGWCVTLVSLVLFNCKWRNDAPSIFSSLTKKTEVLQEVVCV